MPPRKAPSRKEYSGTSRRLLLAFDIGTTFSGISYSILDPGHVPEIKPVTRYPCHEHVGGDSKIPSVIYYNSEGRTRAIGAETLKEGIEAEAERKGWRKAYWFKLHMRPRGSDLGAGERSVPPLPPGKSVEQVFSDYMRYLKQCAKAYISDTHGESLWASVEGDIMYILTHPNGWGGQQQAQLRQSAILAGLIPNAEEGLSSVMFVTEGEASLHFCLSNGLKLPQKKGDIYGILLVDAGGGTIDLTAYRKLPNHTFAEIAVPQCHFQGSAYVTMRAQEYFEGLLDGTRYAADVETLVSRFDRNTKHVFRSEEEAHHIQFASARERDSTLNIRSGRLTISGRNVAKFFEPSVASIVAAIKSQNENARYPIRNVFLVGGFAASPWLYRKLREAIEPLGIEVSRPDTHVNKAVSDGAVSFHVDGAVSTRVARATYGVSMYEVFDTTNPEHVRRGRYIKVHPDLKLPVLYQRFETILPVGTMVKKTQEYRRPFLYGAKDRKQLERRSLDIVSYLGKSSESRHWIQDDPDMYPIVCSVAADTSGIQPKLLNDPAGGVYYQIEYEVVLLFGLTELKAQLAWQEDGVEKRGPASIVYEN